MNEHLEIIQRAIEARRKFLDTKSDTKAEAECWLEFRRVRKLIDAEGVRDEYDVACMEDNRTQVDENE